MTTVTRFIGGKPIITEEKRVIETKPIVTKVVVEEEPSVTTLTKIIEGNSTLTVTRVVDGQPSITTVTRVVEG